jgi:hypothetical protein
MGQLTLDAYEKIFMELLRYVRYLKDEKERNCHFLSGLPQSYQDRIEFDKTKILEDTIRRNKCFYDQSKHKNESSKDWKWKEKGVFQKKGFNYLPRKNYVKDGYMGQPSMSVHQ